MESRIPYILATPIDVAVNGQIEEAQVVDLVAPTKKTLRKTYRLQQLMTHAILSSQKLLSSMAGADQANVKEEVTFDKKAVMAIMFAGDTDVDLCFVEFEKLALSGAVEVNGMTINRVQIDKIDTIDLEGMFAEYVANFTMSSVMRTFTGS